ncbi:MAG: hypothetical protein R3217_04835 [Gammaproteobacteria bacterium]|nr:hypothetical protein [Gammaproteobacteria bacterium]
MNQLPATSDVIGLGPVWLLVLGLLLGLGLFLAVTGIRNFFKGRFFRGPLRSAVGVAFGGLAVGLGGVGLNFHTYSRLNYEEPVATIEFQQIDARQYQALLRRDSGEDQAYGLLGNQFQVDARVLKWTGMGSMLGLDPQYRLERLSGRYASPGDEQTAPRSIYGLGGIEKGINVAKWAERSGPYLPFIDTVYGSAAYMPMADGARYQILITEDGLLARPANAPARAAVQRWQ